MNRFRDLLTYRPGSSDKRQLRQFVRVGLVIVGMLVVAVIFALVEKAQTNAAMAVTRPVVVEGISTASATPPASSMSPADTCPTDPSRWSLVPVGDGQQYDRIDPSCVYDGLGKTIAWVMAAQMGYTRAEANDLLGFSFDGDQGEPAMAAMASVTILAYGDKRQQEIGVYYFPPTPDFAEWYVAGDGSPAITFSILGCFRRTTVTGLATTDWDENYSVVCVLPQDTQAGFHVQSLDGHLYTEQIDRPFRALSLFGYLGEGRWIWLGDEAGIRVDQSGLSQDDLQTGYQDYAGLFGTPIWDSGWLEDSFGVQMRDLPEEWRSANDSAELEAITDLIARSFASNP
jgi:hypothetical protein